MANVQSGDPSSARQSSSDSVGASIRPRSAHARRCPLCGSGPDEQRLHFQDGPWQVHRCGRCELVFLVNPPRPDELAQAYPWERSLAEERAARRKREPLLHAAQRLFQPTRRRLRPNRLGDLMRRFLPRGRILDLGCGTGHRVRRQVETFQLELIPFGIDVEPGPVKAADEAYRALGGRAWCAPVLEGLASLEPESIDGAILHAYLEHELEPRAVLEALARVLRENAPLIVKVPNHGSINRRARGRRWCGYRLPDHVNYFTPSTLSRLFDRAGFDLVRSRFFDRFPLSDNMWAVARRRATASVGPR